jgi:hypothetical protein
MIWLIAEGDGPRGTRNYVTELTLNIGCSTFGITSVYDIIAVR